jgi:hypothetical protein
METVRVGDRVSVPIGYRYDLRRSRPGRVVYATGNLAELAGMTGTVTRTYRAPRARKTVLWVLMDSGREAVLYDYMVSIER